MRKLAAFTLVINAALTTAQPGTLDPSFGDAGFLSTSYSETGTFALNRSVATADGGHITVLTKSPSFSLLKYDATGSQSGQPSAQNQQFANGANFSVGSNLLRLSSGKVIVIGNCQFGGGNRVAIARYNADLTIDGTFGTSGSTLVDLGTAVQEARCIVVLSDGRFLVGGAQGTFGNQPSMVFVMFTSTGAVDASWGNSGIQVVTPPGYWAYARDMAQLPGGGFLVVGGYYDQTNNFKFDVITRLSASGAVDTSFDGDGFVGNTGKTFFRDMHLNADGSFYTLRSSPLDFTIGPELERRLASGALDPAFDGDGIVDLQPQFGFEGEAIGMEVDGSGRILVGGRVPNALGTNSAALLRLLPSGSADPVFGVGGIYTQWSSSSHQYYGFTPLLKGSKVLLTGVDNSNFGDRLLCYLQVFNDFNVGMHSTTGSAELALWPNPASDRLNIAGLDVGIVSFRITDMNGKVVIERNGLRNQAMMQVDIQALVPGRYLIQLTKPEGTYDRVFIKD
jgi:uncharacterized delta-60 repeat protein